MASDDYLKPQVSGTFGPSPQVTAPAALVLPLLRHLTWRGADLRLCGWRPAWSVGATSVAARRGSERAAGGSRQRAPAPSAFISTASDRRWERVGAPPTRRAGARSRSSHGRRPQLGGQAGLSPMRNSCRARRAHACIVDHHGQGPEAGTALVRLRPTTGRAVIRHHPPIGGDGAGAGGPTPPSTPPTGRSATPSSLRSG